MIPLLLLLPGLASDDWATRAAERERLHNKPWLCYVCSAYDNLEAEHAIEAEKRLIDLRAQRFQQKFWTYFVFAATWHSRQEFVFLGPGHFEDQDHATEVWYWFATMLWPEGTGWGKHYVLKGTFPDYWYEEIYYPMRYASWACDFMGHVWQIGHERTWASGGEIFQSETH